MDGWTDGGMCEWMTASNNKLGGLEERRAAGGWWQQAEWLNAER